jgi:predicted Na+-dependent transporter
MLASMNRQMERVYPVLVTLSVVVGIFFPATWIHFVSLVPWVFAIMTFGGSLNASFADVKRIVTHPLPLVVCIFLLHVVSPLIAWGTGALVFPDAPATIAGLVLIFVIPTGIMSLVWVMILNGNIAFTLTLIVVDTLLAPLFVPLALEWIVGSKVHVDTLGMMTGLIWMILLPSLAGLLVNHWTKGSFKKKYGLGLSFFSKFGSLMIMGANSAVVSPYVYEYGQQMLFVVLIVFLLANVNYWLGFAASRLFRWDPPLTTAVMLNTGLRNNTAGAALAIAYFPPESAIPVIGFMLFQQILASLYVRWLNGRNRRLAQGLSDLRQTGSN